MKFLILVLLLVTSLPAPLQAQAEESGASQQQEVWVCPMECDGLTFHEAGSCPVCHMDLVLDAPTIEGDFFASDLLEEAKSFEKPTTALMPGLSTTHSYIGAIIVLLLTLGLALFLPAPVRNMKKTSKRWEYPRWEITRGWFKKLVKWRGFQIMVQVPVVIVFVFVIIVGLFGSQSPSANLAPVLTWNIWWMGLIFFAFFAGEVWCTVCPWMALPDWVSRLGGKLAGRKPLGLNKKWPKWARTLYPAIGLFAVVTWLELAYDAPFRPALTAMMALSMVGLSALTLFVYENKGFCRYLCPVGRITGAYGMSGMLEIRRKDTSICHGCQTKDCLKGNDQGLACPTGEYMGAMNENTYCTMCTECVRTCPHDNVGINIRTPFADLMGPHRRRMDEAWLLLLVLFVSIFHGLAMVPAWTHDTLPPAREWLAEALGFDLGYLVVFTFGIFVSFALFFMVYLAWCAIAARLGGQVRTRDLFIATSYGLLPIALGYHLAHNSLHFFYEGSKLVRLISDPFGWGWDLFGTANNALTMLVPMHILWVGQVILIVVGQAASVLVLRRMAYRMFEDPKHAKRIIVFASLLAVALTLVCLWLLNQPMEMRTA